MPEPVAEETVVADAAVPDAPATGAPPAESVAPLTSRERVKVVQTKLSVLGFDPGGLDGIAGDFSSVSILGLDPAYAATAGIVVDTVGGTDVEIYRLRIARAGVPEPATFALLLLALTSLVALRGRHTRERAAL